MQDQYSQATVVRTSAKNIRPWNPRKFKDKLRKTKAKQGKPKNIRVPSQDWARPLGGGLAVDDRGQISENSQGKDLGGFKVEGMFGNPSLEKEMKNESRKAHVLC